MLDLDQKDLGSNTCLVIQFARKHWTPSLSLLYNGLCSIEEGYGINVKKLVAPHASRNASEKHMYCTFRCIHVER